MEKTEAIEILDYMFEFLFSSAQEGAQTEIDDNVVKKYLSDAGFDSSQIENAIDYLQNMASEVSMQSFDNTSNGLRIYSLEEKTKLGTTALGVLTYLDNRKSITPVLRESIIEQLTTLPYQCELDELLWIIESAALNIDKQDLPEILSSSNYESDKEGTRH